MHSKYMYISFMSEIFIPVFKGQNSTLRENERDCFIRGFFSQCKNVQNYIYIDSLTQFETQILGYLNLMKVFRLNLDCKRVCRICQKSSEKLGSNFE